MYQQSFVVQLVCVFLLFFSFVGYIHTVVLANHNLILVLFLWPACWPRLGVTSQVLE